MEDRAAATGLRSLLAALQARDALTGKHSDAVAQLVWDTAHRMGLSDMQALHATHVALVHDIGKVAIPDAILLKAGPLTAREWQVMRRHPQIGEQIVGSVQALEHLAPAVRAEHERWDGSGYPDGLRGEAIPLSSRLVLACDAYEAMISDRPYRAALAPDVALDELHAHAGSQFDPTVIAALSNALGSARDSDMVSSDAASAAALPQADHRNSTLQSTASERALAQRDVSDEYLTGAGASSLDVLYRRHQSMVYRYCLGILRTPEAAADAAQSAWLQAMLALSAPETVVRNVRAWLRAIARNECLDALRATKTVQTQDISTLELSAGISTEDLYETREQLQSLLVDLKALSERQRAAIVLRELCGLSSRELADELQTTPQRASGLVADARRGLTRRTAGHLLGCEEVREHLRQNPQRPIAVRGHLDSCAECQSIQRRHQPRAA